MHGQRGVLFWRVQREQVPLIAVSLATDTALSRGGRMSPAIYCLRVSRAESKVISDVRLWRSRMKTVAALYVFADDRSSNLFNLTPLLSSS